MIFRILKKDWAKNYFAWLYRHRRSFNIGIILLTLGSLWLASGLELRTDFAELLPEKLQSVISLKKAGERIGGTGLLLVGVESPDYAANRKFVEAMAAKLRPLVGKSLRFFEYRYQDVENFMHKYGLHYLTLEQLQKFQTELEEEIEKSKDSAIGLGLEESEPKQDGQKANLIEKMDPRLQIFLKYRDAYLSADDGKIMVLSLRPLGTSLGVSGSIRMTKQIQSYIDELNPKSFHPQMEVNLAGSVQSAIYEFNTIRNDIIDTAILLVVLIFSVLFLFFWSIRKILLLVANLLFAVAWTFAITKLHIGYLNTQTAFLGSLVVGTGINYGIIFLSRYLELRKTGAPIREAIEEALGSTAIATLIASTTTAVSFLSLLFAENKGLSQFGFIGCIGVAFCWIAAYSLLPLWLYQLELRWPMKSVENPLEKLFSGTVARLGNYFTRRAGFIALLLILISVVAGLGFYNLAKNPIEYNFDNLRNKVAVTEGTEAVESRIHKVFSSSMTPSIVLLDSLAQAEEFCPAIQKLMASLPEDENVIQSCASLYELLPKETQELKAKQAEMLKIKNLLSDPALKHSDQKESIQKTLKLMTLTPPTLNELPSQLTRRFSEKDGRVGYIAFVNPNSDKPLNDGRNLLAFTKSLERIELPKTKTVVSATGDSFILADLLRGLKKDAPIISLIAFSGVALTAIFLAGSLMSGLLMSFLLLVATWWMLGVQGFMDLKYNFFNFIALPLTFGIGVDYPINVFLRCRQEKYRNFGKILATSGTAVFLCSLTTIIGYYTLVGASNMALVSFAKLAIIGEFACLVAALVVLPVTLRFFGKFKPEE
jgi:predicted RND superfamily exporter protein